MRNALNKRKKLSDLLNYRNNFMPLLIPGDLLILYKIIINSDKLDNFNIDIIENGFPYRPRGVTDAVFITRPSDESRIRNTKVIIIEDTNEFVNVGVKEVPKEIFLYKFKKDYLYPALRTITGIKKFLINENDIDYILSKQDENYWVELKKIGLDIPDMLSIIKKGKNHWKEHLKNNIIPEGTHLIIPDKINLSSPNTYFISIFSEIPLKCVGSTLWYFKQLSIEESKILVLYFNSVISLIQFIMFKAETLGTYSRALKNDWAQFKILNINKLTEMEKHILLKLFEKISSIEFPSIIEQLENRFWARVELDKTMLKIIGFSENEANEWLPKFYDALVKDLKSMNETIK